MHEFTRRSLLQLENLVGGKALTFHQITTEFLEKYEAWLSSNGFTSGGIDVKIRCIMVVFNPEIKSARI